MSKFVAVQLIVAISIGVNFWLLYQISKREDQLENLKYNLWGVKSWSLRLVEENRRLRESKKRSSE